MKRGDHVYIGNGKKVHAIIATYKQLGSTGCGHTLSSNRAIKTPLPIDCFKCFKHPHICNICGYTLNECLCEGEKHA